MARPNLDTELKPETQKICFFSLQYGGIIVDVNISEHSAVISFTDYYDGAAPALLVNHTPSVTITIRQRLAPSLSLQQTTQNKQSSSNAFLWPLGEYVGSQFLLPE